MDFGPLYSCDLELEPIIFTYVLDPYSGKIYRMCKYEFPMSRLLKVTIESYHTYIQCESKKVAP